MLICILLWSNAPYLAGEVFDRVTQRMVSFEDVMSVMNKLTDGGGMFFNMQAIQAETLKGQLSNLKKMRITKCSMKLV